MQSRSRYALLAAAAARLGTTITLDLADAIDQTRHRETTTGRPPTLPDRPEEIPPTPDTTSTTSQRP